MEKAYSRSGSKLGGFNNLRRLTYFAAMVETGSFTAAAERLGITKAVVSQQVARLEQEFQNLSSHAYDAIGTSYLRWKSVLPTLCLDSP